MQILWHFPQTVTKSFKEKYDGIKWRNDNRNLKNGAKDKQVIHLLMLV